LVTLRSEGSKPPFFCIHSEGGNVLEYVRLAEHMSHDQPFYALQAQGLKGDRIEGHSVEEMAQHYLEEMKTRQPQGPYFIGGYCLGGLVAYEMARQLEEKGDQVAFLGLISAYSPDHVHQVLASANFFRRLLYQFIERSALEIANLSVLGNRERISYLQDRVRQVGLLLRVQFEGKMDWIISRLRMGPFRHSRPYVLEKVRESQGKAFHKFRPLPIKSRITLFRLSEQSRALVRDPLQGWGGLSAAGIEDYEIKAFHKNILKEPWVKVLSEKLQACLDEAQSRKTQ
jgi:thioesterase domain-containing protein